MPVRKQSQLSFQSMWGMCGRFMVGAEMRGSGVSSVSTQDVKMWNGDKLQDSWILLLVLSYLPASSSSSFTQQPPAGGSPQMKKIKFAWVLEFIRTDDWLLVIISAPSQGNETKLLENKWCFTELETFEKQI